MTRLRSFLLTLPLLLTVIGVGGWLAIQALEYWEQRQAAAAMAEALELLLDPAQWGE